MAEEKKASQICVHLHRFAQFDLFWAAPAGFEAFPARKHPGRIAQADFALIRLL